VKAEEQKEDRSTSDQYVSYQCSDEACERREEAG